MELNYQGNSFVSATFVMFILLYYVFLSSLSSNAPIKLSCNTLFLIVVTRVLRAIEMTKAPRLSYDIVFIC